MRFQLCIQGMRHPTGRIEKNNNRIFYVYLVDFVLGARVISLLRHQDQPSSIISSFQGNNEVAIWNIEKPQTRQKVFWPSAVAALSLTQVRTVKRAFPFILSY